jgi:hypothetical protein
MSVEYRFYGYYKSKNINSVIELLKNPDYIEKYDDPVITIESEDTVMFGVTGDYSYNCWSEIFPVLKKHASEVEDHFIMTDCDMCDDGCHIEGVYGGKEIVGMIPLAKYFSYRDEGNIIEIVKRHLDAESLDLDPVPEYW